MKKIRKIILLVGRFSCFRYVCRQFSASNICLDLSNPFAVDGVLLVVFLDKNVFAFNYFPCSCMFAEGGMSDCVCVCLVGGNF